MNKKITKLLALAMCAVMLFCVLAGCNKDADKPNSATSNNSTDLGGKDDHVVPEIVGTIMLNVYACVEIAYDSEGRVLNVQEADPDGHELLADYAGYLQTPCVEVVKELTELSISLEMLNKDFNHIIIKQLPGAKLPTDSFLEDLATAAKEAASDDLTVAISVVREDELDAEGNISATKAHELIENALFMPDPELIVTNGEIIDGAYAFSIKDGYLEGNYLVDAIYGHVYEGDFITEENPAETEPDEIPEEGDVTVPTESVDEPSEPNETVPDPEVPEVEE